MEMIIKNAVTITFESNADAVSALTDALEMDNQHVTDYPTAIWNAMVKEVQERRATTLKARSQYIDKWESHIKECLNLNWNLGFDNEDNKALQSYVTEIVKLAYKASKNINK